MKLTAKQQRFVDEYLIDLNGTQAAVRSGYSEKTANEQAARLLANVSIRERIDKRLNEIASAKIADVTEVMEYLTAVMRGQTVEAVPRFIGDGVQVFEDNTPKTSDRNKAAELLGRRYAMFTDAVKVTDDRPTIVDDIPGGEGNG